MVRRGLLLIMIVLMCWANSLASEKNQIIDLFDGDSLTQLNKKQCEILSFSLELLTENDSSVVLPQELSIMLGDSAVIKSYPNWKEAYFSKDKKKTNLIVPIYAETPMGIVRSKMIVKCKKDDEYECVIETKVWTSEDKSAFSGVYMESSIDGVFLKGKVYENGLLVSKIENNVKDNVYRKNKKGKSRPWYAYDGHEHFSKFGIYKSSYDTPTPITKLELSSGVIPSNLRSFLP